MEKAREVVGVGFNTIDHVYLVDRAAAAGEKVRVRNYFRQAGGQVPTAMAALSKWGLSTSYVGPLADDDGGWEQRASLEDFGVDLSQCWRVRDRATQTSFIAVDVESGERTIHWHRDEALRIFAADVEHLCFQGVRAVLLDGEEIETSVAVATAARTAGALVVVDIDEPSPEVGTLLGVADIAILPQDFVKRFSGSDDLVLGIRRVGEIGSQTVVATAGAAGAVALSRGTIIHQPAPEVDCIDTTSAGDVFHAGFLFAKLEGSTDEAAISFAAAAAALVCVKLGGRAAIPELADVRAVCIDGVVERG